MHRKYSTTELEEKIQTAAQEINRIRVKNNKIISAMIVSILEAVGLRLLFLNEKGPFYNFYSEQCFNIFSKYNDGSLTFLQDRASTVAKEVESFWANEFPQMLHSGNYLNVLDFISEKILTLVAKAEELGLKFEYGLKTNILKFEYGLKTKIGTQEVIIADKLTQLILAYGGTGTLLEYIKKAIPKLKLIQSAWVKKPVNFLALVPLGTLTYLINPIRFRVFNPKQINGALSLLSKKEKLQLAQQLDKDLHREKTFHRKIYIGIVLKTVFLLLAILLMASPPAEMIALTSSLFIPFLLYLKSEGAEFLRQRHKSKKLSAIQKALAVTINNKQNNVQQINLQTEENSSSINACFLKINFENHPARLRKTLQRAYQHYLDAKNIHHALDKNGVIIVIDDQVLSRQIDLSDCQSRVQEFCDRGNNFLKTIEVIQEITQSKEFVHHPFLNEDGFPCHKIFLRIKPCDIESIVKNSENLQVTILEKDDQRQTVIISIDLLNPLTTQDEKHLKLLAEQFFRHEKLESKLDDASTTTIQKTLIRKIKSSNDAKQDSVVNQIQQPVRSFEIKWKSGLKFICNNSTDHKSVDSKKVQSSDQRLVEVKSQNLPRYTFFAVLHGQPNQLTNDPILQSHITGIMGSAQIVPATGAQGFVLDEGKLKMKFLGKKGDVRLEAFAKERETTREKRAILFHFGVPTANYHTQLKRRNS